MGSLTEKILLYVPCAVVTGLIVGALVVIVAPTIRHLLFASPPWIAHVKAQVQEAYIVGSFRTGLKSGSSVGTASDGPKFRNLKFYIVAQYEYRGKSYTTRSVALYGGDVFLPGSPDGGSDETYFTTAVARLRQVAPNTAYTFIQTDESRIHLSAVKIAMVKLPAGVPNAEMDMPIVNWAPSWNYYNLPFPDGIRRGPLIFFLASLACGLFPGAFVVYLLYKDSGPKGYLYQSWPGWVFGAFFVVLLTLKVYKADQKPPPEKDIDVTIPSSQIHSG